jgi:sRNA-binding regulator protein Hfq
MADDMSLAKMTEALSLEVAAIKKGSKATKIFLRNGLRRELTSVRALYAFPLAEDKRQLRDDMPVRITVNGQEVEGSVVSVNDGVILLSLEQDQGPHIPSAILTVDDSFLMERLRTKLIEISEGRVFFNHSAARRTIAGETAVVTEIQIPTEVARGGDLLNPEQEQAVRKSGGSQLLYIWGPPGTGKSTTLAAIVQLLYQAGKTILLVSNTNVAVDTALEKIVKRLKRERCVFIGVTRRFAEGSQRLCSSRLASAWTCNRPATRASARRVLRARRCPGPSTAS